MKGIQKSGGLLVIVLLIAMIVAGGIPIIGTSYAASEQVTEGNPGSNLSKVAADSGVNEWEITLTVDGSQESRTCDIVMVMDRSRSMNDNGKLGKAKDAAKRFVQDMITNENTRIAVITFNKTAKVNEDFTSDRKDLIDEIDNIDAYYKLSDRSSGTNIQAGLHLAATELSEKSSADIKAVILIGDGEPTYSYLLNSISNVDLSCDGSHNPVWDNSKMTFDYLYADNDGIMDDSNIVGNGSGYTLTGSAIEYNAACPSHNTTSHTYSYPYPANHGVPAIYEAKRLGQAGANIYSFGIGVADEGKAVLKACQNSGYYEEKASSSEYDFSDIANAISTKPSNMIVTDPIGEKFDLIDTADVAVTQGEVSYDPVKAEITWEIGTLDSDKTAKMSYHVKAKDGIIFEPGDSNHYPTNGDTTIQFIYKQGNPYTAEFEVPNVPLTGGAVTLKGISVNQEGKPITSAGAITDYSGAYVLRQSSFPDDENKLIVYGNFPVSMGAISGYQYKGFSCMNTDGSEASSGSDASDNTGDIILTPENSTPTVYFKYYKEEKPTGESSGSVGGGGGGSSKTAATTTPAALNKTDHFAYAIGYPDGLVKPLGTITREEVAVIFYRLMTDESRKAYASTMHPFTDVSSRRWSNNEIATLYNAKIIQGNSDGSFMPGKPITRAEFAVIAAKFDQLEMTTENKFPDIENHWAKDYINSSAIKGWINGYGDGSFRPDNIIIRCEAMKLINEVLDRRVNIAGLHKDTKQWPDNTSDKWYYEIVLEATNTHDYERADKAKSIETWTKIKDNPVW